MKYEFISFDFGVQLFVHQTLNKYSNGKNFILSTMPPEGLDQKERFGGKKRYRGHMTQSFVQ